MIRRPPRSTQSRSSAASDVYKRRLTLLLGPGELIKNIAQLIQIVAVRGPVARLLRFQRLVVDVERLFGQVGDITGRFLLGRGRDTARGRACEYTRERLLKSRLHHHLVAIYQHHPLDLRYRYLRGLQVCLLYTSDAADDLLCVDLG